MSNNSNSGWSDLDEALPEDDEETGFSLDNSITENYSPRNSVPSKDEEELMSDSEQDVEEEEEVPEEDEEIIDEDEESEVDEDEVEEEDDSDEEVEEEQSEQEEEYTSRAQKRIIELNAKKKAAEEEAFRLQEENRKLQQERKKFERSSLENHKAELEDKVEKLMQLRTKARANEDWDAYDAASDELQEARLGIRIADAKISGFEEEDDVEEAKPRQAQPKQQSPEEALAALPDTAQKWIKKNPWFQHDPVMGKVAFATVQELESEGYDFATQTYYDELESRLSRKAPSLFGEMFKKAEKKPAAKKQAKKAPKRRATPKVGSASQAPTGTKTKGGVRKVRLTAQQRSLAQRMGLTEQQYATEVAKLDAAEKRRAKHSLSPNAWVPMELDDE